MSVIAVRRARTPRISRQVTLLVTAAAGWLFAEISGLSGAADSAAYSWTITLLLAVGLYAAAYGIDLREARSHLRTVILAVTVGVLAKVVLITLVMLVVFGDERQVLLAVAVAQIDPLSVAALRGDSRLSPRAKTLLSAWASFDDPVTVLLTAYLATFILHGDGGAGIGQLDTGVGAVLANVGLNAALAVFAITLWHVFRKRAGARARRAVTRIAVAVVVAAILFVAVFFGLLLAMAFIGLFVRPDIAPHIDRLTKIAMYAATFAIGMVLVGGVDWVTGVVLGVAGFCAQILVALALPATGLSWEDRVDLSLAQQNGLTAIVLALLLEPFYEGAAGTIACAVVTINLVHGLSNWPRQRRKPAET